MIKSNEPNLNIPLKEKDSSKTYIYLGTGTCGLGAGAGDTLKKVNEYVSAKGVDAEVVEVGCIGYCTAEPIMEVELPGMNRLAFRQVTKDNVEGILDGVLDKKPVADNILYQQNAVEGKEVWDGVVALKDHPFFKTQTRFVLKNCGLIDPTSIEEYVATGGYKAFAKAISNNTPVEVCDLVESSGLRGRGGGGFPTGRKWKFALNTPHEYKYML